MGRIYSLTMLYNLNTRKHGWHTGNSNGNTDSSEVRQAPINLAGIRTSPSALTSPRETSADIRSPRAEVSRSVRVDEDMSQSGRARVRVSRLSCWAAPGVVSSHRRHRRPKPGSGPTARPRSRSTTRRTRLRRSPLFELAIELVSCAVPAAELMIIPRGVLCMILGRARIFRSMIHIHSPSSRLSTMGPCFRIRAAQVWLERRRYARERHARDAHSAPGPTPSVHRTAGCGTRQRQWTGISTARRSCWPERATEARRATLS